MSADFWASSIAGAIGIIIGNPLDIIKVRVQAGKTSSPTFSSLPSNTLPTTQRLGPLIRGTAAPILGFGALNSILFMTYNRTTNLLHLSPTPPPLWTTFLAGAIGGLATWIISTPIEIIKCRAQLSPLTTTRASATSLSIFRTSLRTEGVRGLYLGGVVTALRDSIGYGFYFWSYELSSRFMVSQFNERGMNYSSQETLKVLLCGGLAGVITWASVFPLDVIKTRVQMQVLQPGVGMGEREALLGLAAGERRMGALEVARNAYKNEGMGVFFRGLMVCSVRAFIVNAAQWMVYEWIMKELTKGKVVGGDGEMKRV